MNKITIKAGFDKHHMPENFKEINLYPSNIYAIVGNTGSGKSRFIKDIAQLVQRDSVSEREIHIDGLSIPFEQRIETEHKLIAHLSQNMRFMLDVSVEEFIQLHAKCRDVQIEIDTVLQLANEITSEPIHKDDNLNLLSGGQSRALMIADIAYICDSPIVLIDEIENAGIDKRIALNALCKQNKFILIVTHDTHTALMANERIVMENGAVKAVVKRTKEESDLFQTLEQQYQFQFALQKQLRQGEQLK